MSRYCTSCGEPLPPDGNCPCGQNIPSTGRGYATAPNFHPSGPSVEPFPQKTAQAPYEEPNSYEDAPIEEEYDPEQEFPEDDIEEPEQETERTPIWRIRRSFPAMQNLLDIIRSYCADPMEACRVLAKAPQKGSILSLMLMSLFLSALGTLVLGTLYLEDFFPRWFCVGIVAPILAFGGSFLFAYILALKERRELYRDSLNELPKLNTSGLLSTVAISSVFPSLLLLASAVLSPMDRNLELFQFFALLILLTWVLSLIFALFFVYRIRFRLFSLFFSILFVFLALVTMRAFWVWFLTGEFHFALYLPLSLFFGGF